MASSLLSSLAMRPARRSLMFPAASSVQKLPRIATSCGPELEADAGRLQRPAADDVFQRIVAEQAQMPRPAAGRDARLDRNAASPSTPRAASASRFGVRAVSSSVIPPGSSGRPPSPSATSITIFELPGCFNSRVKWCMSIEGVSKVDLIGQGT